jgi:WD40 repeat protein
VITTIDGALRLWDVETGIWIATLGDKFAADFADCTFSSDGNFILAKLTSNQLIIYPTALLPYSKSDLPKELTDLESWF